MLPHVKEFRYLRIMFMSDGEMKHEKDWGGVRRTAKGAGWRPERW